jgi:hypothetical protein
MAILISSNDQASKSEFCGDFTHNSEHFFYGFIYVRTPHLEVFALGGSYSSKEALVIFNEATGV